MRRINNRPVAVEAVLTRCGTIVGPFMSELIGYKKLTPSRGGWCGNEMFPEVLTGESRRIATQLVRRLGDRLAKEGYRGFFEVDVLVDTDTDEVYLGELNPRISGASSITNVTAGAYADVPLFLFHILEYMNVDFDLDVDEINERWEELASADVWSQMVMKETDDIVQRLTATPRTGQYSLDASGALVFRRAALDWHQLQNEAEAFFLRIYGPGDYRWKGADLGVLVTKGRLQVDIGRRANRHWRSGRATSSTRSGPNTQVHRSPSPQPPRTNVGRQVGLSVGSARSGATTVVAMVLGGDPGRVPSDVTLENWQSAAHLHWTFQHIADFLPTATISRGTGPVAELPSGTGRAAADIPLLRPDERQADHGRRRDGGHRDRRLDRHPARQGARGALLRRHARRHLAPADVGEQVADRHGGRRAWSATAR